ncbi:protein of unknown function [Modestobacter italicus]|uniref:Uncharacterized protein n=1 Tax=Modestobacter italicus (strain DSM 44449 / CECT 9708 / BC 501) TaxID=2732864 RepID=I4F474_MODI5|nr:protein of unknown function [Modestobacter marinus]
MADEPTRSGADGGPPVGDPATGRSGADDGGPVAPLTVAELLARSGTDVRRRRAERRESEVTGREPGVPRRRSGRPPAAAGRRAPRTVPRGRPLVLPAAPDRLAAGDARARDATRPDAAVPPAGTAAVPAPVAAAGRSVEPGTRGGAPRLGVPELLPGHRAAAAGDAPPAHRGGAARRPGAGGPSGPGGRSAAGRPGVRLHLQPRAAGGPARIRHPGGHPAGAFVVPGRARPPGRPPRGRAPSRPCRCPGCGAACRCRRSPVGTCRPPTRGPSPTSPCRGGRPARPGGG